MRVSHRSQVFARIAKELIRPSRTQGLLRTARSVLWNPSLFEAKAKVFVYEMNVEMDSAE